jgi:hypothetical protein
MDGVENLKSRVDKQTVEEVELTDEKRKSVKSDMTK